MAPEEDVQAALDRLGLKVPAEDLPFLQRARNRQQQLLKEWSSSVLVDSEPALVFKVEKPC